MGLITLECGGCGHTEIGEIAQTIVNRMAAHRMTCGKLERDG